MANSNREVNTSYDGMGNSFANLATYDASGRLDSVTASQDTLNLAYNGVGELARTELTRPDACTNAVFTIAIDDFVFTPDGHALHVRSANTAAVSVDYIWLDDLPVAQFQDSYDTQGVHIGTEATYLHSDHLGTPRIGTNASKQITWRNRSDAFGIADLSGSAVVRLRFPGQLSLGIAGLNYNYYRDYDPKVGRYLESDPVGLAGGLNSYSYVSGTPVSEIDPLGLAACVVNFPDYPIDTGFGFTSSNLGGHGGVLSYDSQGSTRYYEYGRYSPLNRYVIGDKRPESEGNVRRVPAPDLLIDPKTGQPTPASLEALRKALSDRAGLKTRTDLTCDQNADETKVNKWAEDFAKNSSRPKYSWRPWSSNQCRDFANRAYGAGR